MGIDMSRSLDRPGPEGRSRELPPERAAGIVVPGISPFTPEPFSDLCDRRHSHFVGVAG